MTQFVNINSPAGQYFAFPASTGITAIGAVGATGDYLDTVTVIPGTVAPGVVTITDGSTAIITTAAGTATVLPGVFQIPVKAYSKTGAWKITTGTNVSVVITGQFT